MEMTIDNIIEFFDGLECYTPIAKDAKNVATDTMRKYKKIEEILDDCDLEAWEVLEQIRKVVKDENNSIT